MANCIRAISENGGVFFCGVDSTEMVRDMERLHRTSAVTSAALGRLLTAAGMMGVLLKSDDSIVTLRIQGGGPAGIVFATANVRGEVKGYVEQPIVELPPRADGKLDVGSAVGREGTLTVVKSLGLKEPYTGKIPLVSGEIAEDVTSYYAKSEQTPTVCGLGVLVEKDLSIASAGGFLLQLLPGATEEEVTRLEQNILSMQSVTQLLGEGKTPFDMMDIALAGFAPQVLEEQTIFYHCGCTQERVEHRMLSLGEKEIQRLLLEEPTAEAVCQYCNQKYIVDIAALLRQL